MIEVQMGQQDHPNPPLLIEEQARPDRAGIHEQLVIDQESAGTALNRPVRPRNQLSGPMTAQHADIHGPGFPERPSNPGAPSEACG